jgi:hypothetical protein
MTTETQATTEPEKPACSWVKLFHPRGPDVRIALPYEAGELFNRVTALMDQGWLSTAPGLEEGEEKEQVGYVLRGGFERDGQTTPFVLLYAANDQLTWSFLKCYLNTPADVAAFEYASKMTLAALPDYVGNDKPQRGASQKTDTFIKAAPKPFGVVFKKNPKHDDTDAGKMKPARLFVRWTDQRPNQQPTEQSNGEPAKPIGKAPEDDQRVIDGWIANWSNWIDALRKSDANGYPIDIAAFNQHVRAEWPLTPPKARAAAAGKIKAYTNSRNWLAPRMIGPNYSFTTREDAKAQATQSEGVPW